MSFALWNEVSSRAIETTITRPNPSLTQIVLFVVWPTLAKPDLNDFGPSDFRFKPTGSFELVRLYSSRHFGFWEPSLVLKEVLPFLENPGKLTKKTP